MKLAHLLLTHSQPDQVARLVKKLSYGDAHFYIHVDSKTEIAPFLSIGEMPIVFFIKKRVKVSWAGYSIVQATLNGFEEIVASGVQYDYINLLSGQDYPIKPMPHIHNFLAGNPGKIFMHSLSVTDEWQEAIPRFTRYHLLNYNFKGKYFIERLANAVLPARKLPEQMKLMGRSQWFTASRTAIVYILDHIKNHPETVRVFKNSWAPDESIFQTILYNSPHKKDMVNDNLLYVDWSAGGASPKVMTMDDAEKLRQSDKLFARKFSVVTDAKILDYIDSITT